MRKNKVLACVLTAAMVVSGVTLSDGSGWTAVTVEAAEAGDSFTYEDFECTYLEDGTVEISDYDGDDKQLVIPETINGHKVTRIGEGAFRYCFDLTEVEIPAGVTSIGDEAFQRCTSISAFRIAAGNTAYCVVDGALYNYNKTVLIAYPAAKGYIAVADTVEEMAEGVFDDCSNLTSVSIPENGNWLVVSDLGDYDLTISANGVCKTLYYVPQYNGYHEISINTDRGSLKFSPEPYKYGYYGDDGIFHEYFLGKGTIFEIRISADTSDKSWNSIDHAVADISVKDQGQCGENVYFTCKEDTLTISGTGAMGDFSPAVEVYSSEAPWSTYMIKNIIVEDGVTEIGNHAFNMTGKGCSDSLNVVLPDSVTKIGKYAFKACGNLSYIKLPDNLTYIGDGAFAGCDNLSSIELPDKVTYIGDGAFASCESLTSIELSDGVSHIGMEAFRYCTALSNMKLPGNVSYIGKSAFASCESLTDITVDEKNQNYSFEDGVLYNADKSILISCLETKKGTVKIPSSVEYIWDSAFSNCSGLTSIEIPDSVVYIEPSAFYNCSSLTNIVIPDSVTYIGSEAFSGCSGLSSIELSDSVINIGNAAFYNCSSLTHIALPDSVVYMGNGSETDFSYVSICGIFEGCSSLTSVKIPDGVTRIGEEAFYGCSSLTSVEIPDSVTSIGYRAFWGCSSLSSIEIPDSVTSIGSSAFSPEWYGTSALEEVSGGNGVQEVGEGAFSGTPWLENNKEEFIILGNVLMAYTGSDTEVVIPDGVTSVGEGAFEWCENLTSIKIPDGVKSIGDFAFAWCENLTSIEIPDSVTSIGNYAFAHCSALKEVSGGNGVQEVGESAFSETPWLENSKQEFVILGNVLVAYTGTDAEVIIPDGVKSIGEYAFSYCSSLNSIEIPDSVTSIGKYAFSSPYGVTSALKEVSGGNGVQEVGRDAFSGTPWLENNKEEFVVLGNVLVAYTGNASEVVIPDGVVTIGPGAFQKGRDRRTGENEMIKAVKLPDSVKTIGYMAFTGCDSLLNIEIPATVERIETMAFGYTPYEDDGYHEIWDYVTIYGYPDTEAQRYALRNGFIFMPINDAYTPGDVNEDGEVDYFDAMAVLQYDAELTELTENQLLAGDVNSDGNVDSFDAVKILQYDAELIESFE